MTRPGEKLPDEKLPDEELAAAAHREPAARDLLAPTADVLEQAEVADPNESDEAATPHTADLQASEYDALEQAIAAPLDDDYR